MYKVVEKFFSIQGEGYWSGTPMAFVRLSQCPVGGAPGICKTWNGREFACDTGQTYHDRQNLRVLVRSPEHHSYTEVNEVLDVDAIIKWASEMDHLCITGGEPMIYDLAPLTGFPGMVHIETSGTIAPPKWITDCDEERLWITVSPKADFDKEWGRLGRASEWKFLVDKDTDRQALMDVFLSIPDIRPSRVSLQPIEDANTIQNAQAAVRLAMDLKVNVSLQMHKFLRVR
jgi:7-carboxy-7-deazaguanine synthase